MCLILQRFVMSGECLFLFVFLTSAHRCRYRRSIGELFKKHWDDNNDERDCGWNDWDKNSGDDTIYDCDDLVKIVMIVEINGNTKKL